MSKKTQKLSIGIRRESVLQSVISDTFSFIYLGGFFWFNYKFVGGSYFLNGLILFTALLYAFVRPADDKKLQNYKGVSDEKIEEIIKILEEKN